VNNIEFMLKHWIVNLTMKGVEWDLTQDPTELCDAPVQDASLGTTCRGNQGVSYLKEFTMLMLKRISDPVRSRHRLLVVAKECRFQRRTDGKPEFPRTAIQSRPGQLR
jgi:hypothetical protein